MCLEEYNEDYESDDGRFPMMLCSAQHSACKKCVKSTLFKGGSRESKCPECRKVIFEDQVNRFRYLHEIQQTWK